MSIQVPHHNPYQGICSAFLIEKKVLHEKIYRPINWNGLLKIKKIIWLHFWLYCSIDWVGNFVVFFIFQFTNCFFSLNQRHRYSFSFGKSEHYCKMNQTCKLHIYTLKRVDKYFIATHVYTYTVLNVQHLHSDCIVYIIILFSTYNVESYLNLISTNELYLI